MGPTDITFNDPMEQHWQEMQQREEQKRESQYPPNPEPYLHPNDNNLIIYHEQRNREPWTEQYEMHWFDPQPTTSALIKREEYALRELA